MQLGGAKNVSVTPHVQELVQIMNHFIKTEVYSRSASGVAAPRGGSLVNGFAFYFVFH